MSVLTIIVVRRPCMRLGWRLQERVSGGMGGNTLRRLPYKQQEALEEESRYVQARRE